MARNIKKERMDDLFNTISVLGAQKAYEAIKDKAFNLISKSDNLDSDMLDMADAVIKMIRDGDIEEKNTKIYYLSASMLRKLAHALRIEYIKIGKETKSDDTRFIRLVSFNKDITTL